MKNKNCLVYKFYNKNNDLLYVGITNNLKIRLKQHKKDKEWFKEINKIFISNKMNRNSAHIYEIYIIANDKPIYNSDHTQGGCVDIQLPLLNFMEYKSNNSKNHSKNNRAKIDTNVVFNLYREGNSIDDIAKILNYSSGYISQQISPILIKLGVKPKCRRNSYDERLEVLNDIIKTINISKKDYLTIDDLLNEFMAIYGCAYETAREYYKNEFKPIIDEILDIYNLKRIRSNKEIKNEYGISGKGYPFLIVKNKD